MSFLTSSWGESSFGQAIESNIDSTVEATLSSLQLSILSCTTSVLSDGTALGALYPLTLSILSGEGTFSSAQIHGISQGAFSNCALSTLIGNATFANQYPSVIQDFGPKTIQIIT